MKTTNLTTPRSLDECQFHPGMDPITRPDHDHKRLADQIICWLVLVGTLCIIGGVAFGVF